MLGKVSAGWANISAKDLVTGYGIIADPFLIAITLPAILNKQTPRSTANVVGCYSAHGAPVLEPFSNLIRIVEPAR